MSHMNYWDAKAEATEIEHKLPQVWQPYGIG